MVTPKLRQWRVKEVWKVTSWSYVTANTREEAEMAFEDCEGDFDEHGKEAVWEYDTTIGDIEEVLP